jgi:hypothetical protein
VATIEKSRAMRGRLWRVDMPDMPSDAEMQKVQKKSKGDRAPKHAKGEVDISARAASAAQMESEIQIEKSGPLCIVHKGPISGLSYTCTHCGVVYCLKCATALATSGEKCWNCGEIINEADLPKVLGTIPGAGKITVFDPEVFEKLEALNIPADAQGEILLLLKDVDPAQRVAYLADMFFDSSDNDDF